jgi:uncharacterized membrane protein YfcA
LLWALGLAALVGSTISGALGSGGGIVLLAVMVQFLAPGVAIPIHGAVQVVSNTWRGLLYVRHCRWQSVGVVALGALPGTVLGTALLSFVPEPAIQLILGIFVLVATLLPLPTDRHTIGDRWLLPLGFVSGGLSMVIGTVGPLLASFFLRRGLSPAQQIATKTWCMSTLHAFKLGGFLALGFHYASHAVLMLVMMGAVLVGNVLGKRVLSGLRGDRFTLALRAVLVLLAARILWRGVGALLG